MPTSEDRKAARKAAQAQVRDAHKRRVAIAGAHAGRYLRKAIQVHWKDATFTTWAEAVTALAGGVTITIQCNDAPGTKNGWTKHRLRLHADGSVGLDAHPDLVIDAEAEMLLAALGGNMSPCVAAAISFPPRSPIPTRVITHHTLDTQVRALHAAVQWAQHPDVEWTVQFGESVLKYGITPASLAPWLEQGWGIDTAIRFQQQWADLPCASAWRTHGDTSKRAAKLAGAGEYPDDEAAWTVAGFTKARSARWRKHGLSPAEAYEWDRHNVAPTMVDGILKASARNAVPVEVYQQWCAAGIPSTDVINWHRATGGRLSEALAWCQRPISPEIFEKFKVWNDQMRHAQIRPDQAREFLAAGFPRYRPELVARALGQGISAQDMVDAVEQIHNPHSPVTRWLIDNQPEDESRVRWTFETAEDRARAVDGIKRGWSRIAPMIVEYLLEHRTASTSRAAV